MIILTYTPKAKDEVAPPKGFNSEQFLKALKSAKNDHANAEISYARWESQELAVLLRDLFNEAGWQTNYNNLPLESARLAQLPRGIEVNGHNGHFVGRIANALTSAGLTEVVEKIALSGIRQDNPKWPFAQNKVHIVIGLRK